MLQADNPGLDLGRVLEDATRISPAVREQAADLVAGYVREQALGALAPFASGDTLEDHRERDVFESSQAGHEVERLEDEPDFGPADGRALGLGECGEVRSVDSDCPLGGGVEPPDEIEQRRLARPTWPHDRGVRPLRQRE